MILFASLVALAFSGCGDYSDCSSCTSSSSSCNWVVSRLRRNLGGSESCVEARRQLTETESRRNLATYTTSYDCPAAACTDHSNCVDCAQNDCEWVVSSRRSLLDTLSKRRNLGASCADPHRRRQLATVYYTDYSTCPATACTDNSDCTSCAQNGCEWTEGRRNLGATDSYASSSGSCADVSSDSSYDGRRRKLASASAGITDYSYCPAEEAVVTEAPEPLEERWWFVMMLVIVIGIFVWIGVGFLINSGEVDKHESDWGLEKQKTMDFSHAHEAHGHDDHGHGDHGAGGHDLHHGDDPHGHNSHGHDSHHGHDDHGKRGPHAPHGHHDTHGHNSPGHDSHGHNNHGTHHGGHQANHGHSRGYDREYITE